MIYLDNAATTFPKPKSMEREYARCIETYAANAGRGSHYMSRLAAEKVWDTREQIARLFHITKPHRIVFTSNCTEALNMGLKGILKAGDDLVISSMEHNSVYRPAVALRGQGVRTVLAQADKEGIVSPEEVERCLTPRTKLVCILHASNVTGGINPIHAIGELLHRRKILFMVDAAQTAGCVPIDTEKDHIDILAFPGHKGLMGPQGTGGLYVRDGLEMRPLKEGGTGSASELPVQPEFLPDRLESGTLNLPGIAGLYGGVQFILEHGEKEIGAYENHLASVFRENVEKIKGVRILGPKAEQMRVGLVSLVTDRADPVDIAMQLDKNYAIAVRAGLHCAPLAAATLGILDKGSLRFSPGIFNTENDMLYAARALREILE